MPRQAWDPRLTAWLDRVEDAWASSGVSPRGRQRLRDELVADLAQAVREGAPVGELVAVDPRRFARDVALAAGWPDRPGRSRPARGQGVGAVTDSTRLVGAALLGTALGGVLALLTVYPVGWWLVEATGPGVRAEGVAAIGMHVLACLLAAATGAAAVRVALPRRPQALRVAGAAALALLVSGSLAVLPTVVLASTTGFSTEVDAVLLEAGLVLLFLTGGLQVVTRRAGLSGREPPAPPTLGA